MKALLTGRALSLSGISGGALGLLVIIAFPVALAALLAGAANGGEEEGARVNPHVYNGKYYCSVCHSAEPPKLNFDSVTTCTRCHMGNVGDHPVVKHPIGKQPRINMPRDLPLNRDGQIVCYTCHDPHNKTRHPKMLRVDYSMLCASCHVGY